MYPKYFGLNESGFSITPDPHYLFLSRQHREALAHLTYGTADSGGFVLLTGEVGTGKTTVCRAFLERLPEHVEVALIFNPALNGRELLEAVCREFGVGVPRRQMSTHDLLDLLNSYLLEAHARGRKPVLIIDEAQNLSHEVLEQVRLLTNLETTKHKLLQIFLIGQPELRDLLGERRLRQVAQRITARYHLAPLRRSETGEYIRHRLRVAGAGRDLFKRSALHRIHRLTGGIPRLINILCDRALLGAYATGQQIVDWRTVGRAARELRGEGPANSGDRWRSLARTGTRLAYLTLLLGAVGVGVLAARWYPFSELGPEVGSQPSGAATTSMEPPSEPQQSLGAESLVSEPMGAMAEDPSLPEPVEDVPSLDKAVAEEGPQAPVEPGSDLAGIAAAQSRPMPVAERQQPPLATNVEGLLSSHSVAMSRLLAVWGIDYSRAGGAEPCQVARSDGVLCRALAGTWTDLGRYDRPAVIRLRLPTGQEGEVVLIGLGPERARIDLGDRTVDVAPELLQRYWDGQFLLLWRPPITGDLFIGRKASQGANAWLRETLARASSESLDRTDPQDPEWPLKAAVIHFQQAQGLDADGIAGPDTIIRLNTLSGRPNIPRIRLPN